MAGREATHARSVHGGLDVVEGEFHAPAAGVKGGKRLHRP